MTVRGRGRTAGEGVLSELAPAGARVQTQRLGATLIHAELATMALESGWALQSTAERVRNRDATTGYIVKLAGMAAG